MGVFTAQVISDRISWYYCILKLVFFLSVISYFHFFTEMNVQSHIVFHVLIVCFLFFISSWILGEMTHLYLDRVQKNRNLFLKVHSYYGTLWIPIFIISIFYSMIFLKHFLWVGAFIFFVLEALRFLFRLRSHVYEILICLYLCCYAWMIVI